jgi:MAC/Perforin domain
MSRRKFRLISRYTIKEPDVNDVQPLEVNQSHAVANLLADTPIYSQFNALGQGFDVYGALDSTSFKKAIVDFTKEGLGSRVFRLLGKDYLVPSCVAPMPQTKAYNTDGTYMSRNELQKSFAERLGVEASYGAFSAEMKTNYSKESSDETASAYSYTNHYSEVAVLALVDPIKYVSEYFLNCVKLLPSTLPSMPNVEDLSPFVDFFNEFGAYYTRQIVLGGKLGFYSAVSSEAHMTRNQVSKCMKASYNSLFSSASVERR